MYWLDLIANQQARPLREEGFFYCQKAAIVSLWRAKKEVRKMVALAEREKITNIQIEKPDNKFFAGQLFALGSLWIPQDGGVPLICETSVLYPRRGEYGKPPRRFEINYEINLFQDLLKDTGERIKERLSGVIAASPEVAFCELNPKYREPLIQELRHIFSR